MNNVKVFCVAPLRVFQVFYADHAELLRGDSLRNNSKNEDSKNEDNKNDRIITLKTKHQEETKEPQEEREKDQEGFSGDLRNEKTRDKPDETEETAEILDAGVEVLESEGDNEDSILEEESLENENLESVSKEAQLAEERLLSLQRLQAEFDNFRKREEKQKQSLKKFVTSNVILELLPVVDNFERALEVSEQENTTLKTFSEGMKMVFQQMEDVFSRIDVKRMEALNQKFDPLKHSAMSKESSDTVEKEHVLKVLQNGWLLDDQVIRPAFVTVSEGAEKEELSEEAQEETQEEVCEKKV